MAQHPSIARAIGLVRANLERALGLPHEGGRPARLLLACSGGPDSVALVGLCDRLRRSMQLELVVAHVDHGLRPESRDEAAAVLALAGRLGLEHREASLDLSSGPGLPARAREARRAALVQMAADASAGLIALGHTATDQAETMLMHLVRGAGLDGIAAMPEQDAPWLRPLLRLTREQTRELCERLELSFVEDPTNRDPRHLRVRIREQVLPVLREENAELERAFLATAGQARDAEEALHGWAERECASRARGEHHWDITDLDEVPRAVRTRMLRALCAKTGVDLSELRHQVVEAIDAAIVAQARARRPPPTGDRGGPGVEPRSWDLHPNRRLRVQKDGIFVQVGATPNH